MPKQSAAKLSSGIPFDGTINLTMYEHCVELAQSMLLAKSARRDAPPDMPPPRAALLLNDPLSGEMAMAFGKTIIDAVLYRKEFNTTIEEEISTMYEVCKVWSWGHTYVERGNVEIPGWFFRHVELFLYHVLLYVVTRIGSLSHSTVKKLGMTNVKLCEAIDVVCRIAKGAAEALPAGAMSKQTVSSSGTLLLLSACEAVEFSLLLHTDNAMHRGHVIFAMVVAKDAVNNPSRNALGDENTFAHLFAAGTPLNFLHRAAAFCMNWKDKTPTKTIGAVEREMIREVFKLDDEAKRRRKRNRKSTIVSTSTKNDIDSETDVTDDDDTGQSNKAQRSECIPYSKEP